MVGVVALRVHDFAQTEVRDLDVTDAASRQQNVAWNVDNCKFGDLQKFRPFSDLLATVREF